MGSLAVVLTAFSVLVVLHIHREPNILLLAASQGVDRCEGVNDRPVVWNETEQRCEPDVCGGVTIQQLPDVLGWAPAHLLCRMRLFDTDRARACLAGKRIVVLGDSTCEGGHQLQTV